MSVDWTEALRRECAEMTRFCRELSDEEWRTPSAAQGWRIQDVVAHVGGALHSLFTPASLKLVTSKDKTHNTLVLKALASGSTYCRVGTGLGRTVLIHIVVTDPPS